MDSIKEKIAKILALASDPAAAEGEAKNARQKAIRLMKKHGLEEDDLDDGEDTEIICHKYWHDSYRTKPSWYGILAGSCARYNGCYMFYTSKARKDNGERGLRLTIYGQEHRIEQTIYTLESLEAQINHLTKEWRKETGASRRQTNGYRNGLVTEASLRLKELMRPSRRDVEDVEGGQALVRLGQNLEAQSEEAEAKARGEHNIRRKGYGSRFDASGGRAGRRDGKRLSVRKGVSSGQAGSRQLGS